MIFLEELSLTRQSAVLSEKLGDLYSAQGKPSSSVHAYEQALKLEPSPQQRIRLMLVIGEKEVNENKVSVRRHGHGDTGSVDTDELIASLKSEIRERS